MCFGVAAREDGKDVVEAAAIADQRRWLSCRCQVKKGGECGQVLYSNEGNARFCRWTIVVVVAVLVAMVDDVENEKGSGGRAENWKGYSVVAEANM